MDTTSIQGVLTARAEEKLSAAIKAAVDQVRHISGNTLYDFEATIELPGKPVTKLNGWGLLNAIEKAVFERERENWIEREVTQFMQQFEQLSSEMADLRAEMEAVKS